MQADLHMMSMKEYQRKEQTLAIVVDLKVGGINKTQVQKGTVHIERHCCKRHQTTSSVLALSECDTQHH